MKIFSICFLLFIGAVAYYFVYMESDNSGGFATTYFSTVDSKSSPKFEPSTPVVKTKRCPEIERIDAQSQQRRPTINVSNISKIENESSIDTLLLDAERGNSDAALVLFSALQQCESNLELLTPFASVNRRLTKNECLKIPSKYLKTPSEILVPAADNGSNEARKLYLQNAYSIAQIMLSSMPAETVEATRVLNSAERYGVLAAKAGDFDAYLLLSFNYLTGSLGSVDLPRAYAYAFAAKNDNSPESVDRVDYIYRKMTKQEVDSALNMVGSCRLFSPDITVTTNPFR